MKLKQILFFIALVFIVSCEDSFVSNQSPSAVSDSNSLNIGSAIFENTTGLNTNPSSNEIIENPFIDVSEENTSTFSIDADGASYSTVRRFLTEGIKPIEGVIRTEELINYFNYDYNEPYGVHPISLEGEMSSCPWNQDHKLIRIGIKGKEVDRADVPPANIVFLIDVSGSMSPYDRLPLLKTGLKKFVREIRSGDKISIVTYAGDAGLVLEPTSNKQDIINAIDGLGSGGSTNGEGGIIQAYKQAEKNIIECGNNRVIVASDGGFNVGAINQEDLVSLIEEKRELGIFLTILGVGGNVNEGLLEQIANNGNGNYEYLDNEDQLDKVFINEYNKFYTVAKDVKVQVSFNKNIVQSYRLIGYENRLLENDEFLDDTKDAGEIGADQSITALYEIIPTPNLDKSPPAFNIEFRYKDPKSSISKGLTLDIKDKNTLFENASDRHRFASAVASYGLLLRDSQYKGNTSFEYIKKWAEDSKSHDLYGYKNEFIDLIDLANDIY